MVATAIGVGIGMLAAPDAGPKTRRRLRSRLAAWGEDFGDGLFNSKDAAKVEAIKKSITPALVRTFAREYRRRKSMLIRMTSR